MASIFSKGVRKASGRMQEMRENLTDLISVMEAKTDLRAFDSKHPELLAESIKDLKEARKLIYSAIGRLNFPQSRINDQEYQG